MAIAKIARYFWLYSPQSKTFKPNFTPRKVCKLNLCKSNLCDLATRINFSDVRLYDESVTFSDFLSFVKIPLKRSIVTIVVPRFELLGFCRKEQSAEIRACRQTAPILKY